MNFRFRLERVLRLRQRQVETVSRELAAARSALAAAEADARRAARDLQTSRQEAAAARQGWLDPAQLARLGAWHDAQRRVVERRQAEVADAQQAVAAVQARLQEAWRDREVLERLRERQYQQWRLEEARRERRDLDEIGSIRAAMGAATMTVPDGAES